MFQDGSVKTILTRSQKPLKPLGTRPARDGNASAPVPQPPLAPCDSILPLNFARLGGRGCLRRAPRRISFNRFRPNDFKSFDPLFKVLFIFPSQYLFAIGFPHIFSLRRSLSPTWCTSIKVHDSSTDGQVTHDTTDGALTLSGVPLATTSASRAIRPKVYRLQFAGRGPVISILGFSRFRRPYWGNPS